MYRAGGDPELANPAVAEKIDDIEDFYTDRQHIRAGMAEFTAAACFYTALFGAHPGSLDWTIYNIPTDYASNPSHDRFPTLQITSNRAEQVCDVIWEVFTSHPFCGVRVSPFAAGGPDEPDTACLWGANGFGQLGRENRPAIAADPVAMDAAIEIIPGGEFALGRKPGGGVLGWGRNHRGQLGDATFVSRAFPFEVLLLPPASALACGREHAAAVTANGEIWAWGSNNDGELGDDFGRLGHTINGFPVPPENGRARRVNGLPPGAVGAACGAGFTVALFGDGTVWAWGRNGLGQLGGAAGASRSTPQAVGGLPAIGALAAGDAFVLALALDGTVWAWGANNKGQLGLGHGDSVSAPSRVSGLASIAAVAAGGAHAMATGEDGTLFVWGDNAAGQLGVNPAVEGARNAPGVLNLSNAVRQAAAGGAHSLALLADRSLRAWGANGEGQLGDGTTVSRWTPEPVPAIPRAASVRAGGNQSLAVTAPARPSYAAWRNAHFSPEEIAAGLADPGHDFSGSGFGNFFAYALGRDPRAAWPEPPLRVRAEDGGLTVEAEFLAAAADVAVGFETSRNLVDWIPAAPVAAEVVGTDDMARATLRFNPGPSCLFVRMRVQGGPAGGL